ncbi:MAG: S1 RNA-binding domain-containing protein, partial [Vampirovibrionia bacterium]
MSPGGTIWDSNKPEEELNEFEKLLSSYDYTFNRGDVIKGTIIGFESNGVSVDVGAKTFAFVPIRELTNESIDKPSDAVSI